MYWKMGYYVNILKGGIIVLTNSQLNTTEMIDKGMQQSHSMSVEESVRTIENIMQVEAARQQDYEDNKIENL